MRKRQLNTNQIKLLQTAVKAAGIRTATDDGRYRLLLGQYRRGSGKPVTSCKDLTNDQVNDILAICESMGWRHPNKSETFYRDKIQNNYTDPAGDFASFAQQSAIKHLANDLGWTTENLNGMIARMTGGHTNSLSSISPHEAHKIIEALKAMFQRDSGLTFNNLSDLQRNMEVTNNDSSEEIQSCPF